MILEGDFYSGATSRRRSARLRLEEGALTLELDDEARSLDWAAVQVSPRVGNTPRYLHLPEDGVFETSDNDGVDALSRQFRSGLVARWVHRLENHLGLILVAAVVTVLVTLGTFLYGLPWTSRVVAGWMPESVVEQASTSTLQALDATWMAPSTLSAERQAALQSTFSPYLDVAGRPVTVLFRDAEGIGPNAMALPDGTVVFTDQLVNLAEDDRELVAVLAHELGHVAHNHGMEGLVHSSLTAWLIVMMTGDLSSFADSTVAGPAVLLNLAYSRDMEREADQFALDTMQARGLDPNYFVIVMQRMESAHGGGEPGSDETGEQGSHEEESEGWLGQLGALVSSHPLTDERLERFREASR
ncbi:M48 family metallopeptidase [Marinobacter sp. JSM 1782161]|uniref:M48 family metallopeptidase n=1 Tax=Marinobacter sp. JSM 1782161 TaxID=2685906 RepID=UPI001403D8AB|nr:M48 family metallopeptidase [Marinobacter sp. JSM 1782161]